MGYTKIVPRMRTIPPHTCPVPLLGFVLLAGYGVGTRWVCDACSQPWIICGNGHNPTKWEKGTLTAADILDGAAKPNALAADPDRRDSN